MNPIAIIAAVSGVIAGTIVTADTIKTEHAKRKEIRLKTEKEIAAIRAAGAIVKQKIRSGEINSIDQAMSDVEFYKIILLNQ